MKQILITAQLKYLRSKLTDISHNYKALACLQAGAFFIGIIAGIKEMQKNGVRPDPIICFTPGELKLQMYHHDKMPMEFITT